MYVTDRVDAICLGYLVKRFPENSAWRLSHQRERLLTGEHTFKVHLSLSV